MLLHLRRVSIVGLCILFPLLSVAEDRVVLNRGGFTREAGTSVLARVEARTYDVSEAVAAFVRKSALPEEKAREEALRELLAPATEVSSFIKHEEIAHNQYKVWATRAFHDSFQLTLDWMKHGKKQITIEARVVTVSAATLAASSSLLI